MPGPGEAELCDLCARSQDPSVEENGSCGSPAWLPVPPWATVAIPSGFHVGFPFPAGWPVGGGVGVSNVSLLF